MVLIIYIGCFLNKEQNNVLNNFPKKKKKIALEIFLGKYQTLTIYKFANTITDNSR